MDQIDINLFNAWHRVSAAVRRDRVEQLKRASRQFRVMVRKPLRAMCLCLRAADTRLSPMNCIVEPRPGDVLGPDTGTDNLIDKRLPHIITIPGTVIRELMKPIYIPWPGEDWKRVAARCGVSKDMIYNWLRAGTMQCQCRVPARTVGSRGKPVMMVYTPTPIDPNSFDARPPNRGIWGEMWQNLWTKIPEEYSITAERFPRTRMLNGREVFRGWTWVCPGRVGLDGASVGCGRTCNRLFMPLPVWTVPQAVGDRLEIDADEVSGLAGAWSPGFTDPDQGKRSFACKRCWGVRDISLIGPDGWNAFAAHVTGGLLYGHEVERPRDEVPETRRRRKTTRRTPPEKYREPVREMILQGLTDQQIADRLGISYGRARRAAGRIYRDAGVRTKAAYLAMCREQASTGGDPIKDTTGPSLNISHTASREATSSSSSRSFRSSSPA